MTHLQGNRTAYQLRLFGTFGITVDGNPIEGLSTTKVSALIAYLAMETIESGTNEISRRKLASLLWPDIGDKYALQNLRGLLYRVRRAFDANDRHTQIIHTTRQSVTFDLTQIEIDLLTFQALTAAVAKHEHEQLATCDDCMARLNQAQALYRGELLAGLSMADAPTFEEWLLLHRERWHQQVLSVADRLCSACERRGDNNHTLVAAQRLLQLDPFREDAHRAVMRVWALRGLPNRALAQYQKLQQLLEENLGLAVDAETAELARQIQAGTVEIDTAGHQPEREQPTSVNFLSPPQHTTSEQSNVLDVSEVPIMRFFYGRRQELEQLAQWLVHERSQVIAILGMGGMGKTSLAVQFVHSLAQGDGAATFDAVIWRTLLNAPPLGELLPPILQQLSDQQLTQAPEMIDEQLRLLLRYLRQKRVLLVLDNLESILEAGRAGEYRPGYEPYAQLIQNMATHDHSSHLLFTSRERPRGYQRLERDNNPVRSLQIAGLDPDAGRELLEQRGVFGTGEESMLIARYSGNPLALKLVADTVEAFYEGSIAGFLSEESLVFDDIRTVLDHQFTRLSDLERELLLWLAISREPVSMTQLRDDLLHPPPQRLLVEALRNLQRRSLIEHQGTLFTLQNVVAEYLTDRLVEKVTEEVMRRESAWLHSHALLKAQAKEYVRQSQERLILQPVARQLEVLLDKEEIAGRISQIITQLQQASVHGRSYAAGNLLNLLRQVDIEITGYDFSHLYIRQANLRGWALRHVNFHGANFSSSLFTASFSTPHSMAIDPTGEFLVVGTEGGAIRVWALANAEPTQVLHGHTQRVSAVVFHPERNLLASSSLDDTIRLWDLDAGETIRILQLPTQGGGVLAFSPDGRVLASGGRDGQIYLWDAESGRLLHQIESQVRWVYALAFSPQGTLLAGSGRPKFIYLWALSQLEQEAPGNTFSDDASASLLDKPLVTLQTKHAPVPSLAFSPDGNLLIGGSGGYVTEVWDLSDIRSVDAQPKWTFDGDGSWVRSLAVNPDGSTVASGTNDGHIYLSNLQSGRRIDVLTGHTHFIYALAFDPQGKILVSASEDNTVRMWTRTSEATWQLSAILQSHMPGSNAVAFSPNGTTLAVGDTNGLVHLWHGNYASATSSAAVGDDYRHETLTGHTNSINAIAYHANGRLLATAGIDRTIRIWDLQPGKGERPRCVNLPVEGSAQLKAVGLTSDGRYLYSSDEQGNIRIWQIDAAGQTTPYRLLRRDHVATVAVAIYPQGNELVEANYAGAPHLWEIAEEKHLMELSELRDVTSLRFHPDGTMVAAGSRAGSIGLWEMSPTNKGKLLGISTSCESPIWQIAFSPRGDMVAGACEDGAIRLWGLNDLETHHTLLGHRGTAASVAFHPNEVLLASGGSDGTVKLWDVATGECISTLELPRLYQGMDITDVTGISEVQRSTLKALGAVESGDLLPTLQR